MKPPLKWIGSKRRILPTLLQHFRKVNPNTWTLFVEPFLGSGAVLLALRPKMAIVGDSNRYLIAMYTTIKHKVEPLITQLRKLQKLYWAAPNPETVFYKQRKLFNTYHHRAPSVAQVARFIFLNKTCFNGIYRVNKEGQFNTSHGRNGHPAIVDPDNFRNIANYLNTNSVTFVHGDYTQTLEVAKKRRQPMLMYIDPPYQGTYARYGPAKFLTPQHVRLATYLNALSGKNQKQLQRYCHHIFVSNSNTKQVRASYPRTQWRVTPVTSTRTVNSKTSDRKAKTGLEVLMYKQC